MERSGCQIATGAKPPKTTFVQTDSTCFRDIVQRLTGSQPEDKETETMTSTNSKLNTASSSGSKGQAAKLKLHERRQYPAKPMSQIPKPGAPTTRNQIQQSIITTDLTLHSPSSTLYNSSSTPKQNSPSWSSSCFMRSPLSSKAVSASSPSKRGFVSSPSTNHKMDEDANNVIMKERRRLYLQSSPRSKETPDIEPELLTLFPLTSPTTDHVSIVLLKSPGITERNTLESCTHSFNG